MDCDLLYILQKVREKYGATKITSGFRCVRYNLSLSGSVVNSLHTQGKAADFYVAKCETEQGRKEVMAYLKTLPRFKYTYCNINNDHPNMGKSIHIEVK